MGFACATPRVIRCGDKTRYARLRLDVSHYLKWSENVRNIPGAISGTKMPALIKAGMNKPGRGRMKNR